MPDSAFTGQACLAFLIDCPMQSWGTASRFSQRDTADFPTKSGIIGLLSAACGVDKYGPAEREQLAPLAALRMKVIWDPLEQNHGPGRSYGHDLQTIGGGWNRKDRREKMCIPRKADGGPFGCVLTRRTCLEHANFAVLLQGPRSTLKRVKAALDDPVWGLWFGRKSALPATPLSPALGDTAEKAFHALRLRLGLKEKPLSRFSSQSDAEADCPETSITFQEDHPVSFGTRRFEKRPLQHCHP